MTIIAKARENVESVTISPSDSVYQLQWQASTLRRRSYPDRPILSLSPGAATDDATLVAMTIGDKIRIREEEIFHNLLISRRR